MKKRTVRQRVRPKLAERVTEITRSHGEVRHFLHYFHKDFEILQGLVRGLGTSIDMLEQRVQQAGERCYTRHLDGVRAMDELEHRGKPLIRRSATHAPR